MASEQEIQDGNAPLRMAKSQRSYNGLKAVAGRIQEECNRDLQWPDCIKTYKLMFKDATIAPAMNLMEMDIAKVQWSVKIPDGYDSQLKSKAEYLESVMNDMDHSWYDFIRRASTFNRYGFAPVEKVYRRRSRAAGSKYNDGLIGIESLPLIDQDSIRAWEWENDGRKLAGVRQWVNKPSNLNGVQTLEWGDVLIPRKKFILFRADPQKDSPEGTSPLNAVYTAWRFKTELEKFESTGVSQDLRGLKKIKLPARYMSEDATEAEKATYEVFKEMLRGLHNGEQSGVIIPSETDDQGKPLFEFSLESVMGQSTYDVNEIIGRYRKEIITGILCPQLILGQDGSGSFALSESLSSVTDTVVGARLREIRDQLNHDLIPQLFMLNGWDTSVMPYFDFEDFSESTVDDFSKAIQRMASVGMLVPTAETVNFCHEKIGAPKPFDKTDISVDEVRKFTTPDDSKAGEGMSTGSGNGTSNSAASRDNSTSNAEN